MKNKTNLTLFTILICASMFMASCEKNTNDTDPESVKVEKLLRNPDYKHDVNYVKPQKIEQMKQEYEQTQKKMQELDSINRMQQLKNKGTR